MRLIGRIGVVAFAGLWGLAVPGVRAQAQANAWTRSRGKWVGAPREEYERLLQLTGATPLSSQMIRPTEMPAPPTVTDTAAWRSPWGARFAGEAPDSARQLRLTVWDPVLQTAYNSAFPYGQNDGPMWAGRGVSAEVTGGAGVQWGPVTLDLVPTYTWSENRAFVLAPLVTPAANALPWADQFESKRVDLPQRFGDRAVSLLDWGQSALTVQGHGVRGGVASRNVWWGPGIDNALIITNNAAGFPHAFLATQRPASVGIGRVEVMYLLGTLRQTRFWRTAADTFARDRWVNGLTMVFEPKGAPGMYLGATRLFYSYQRSNPISLHEILTLVQPLEKKNVADSANPSGNDRRDQMLSLNFRFAFPQAGFEAYGEWGKNDHNWDRRDAFLEPDHARGLLLGVRKVYRAGDGILSVRYETVTLGFTTTSILRDTPTWYAHHIVQQGFTEKGQVIGAGAPLGGSQQTLAIDWFHPRGRWGVLVVRDGGNTDAFYRNKIPDLFRMPASLLAGPRATLFAGAFQIDATYMFQYDFNRYTGIRNDVRNHRLELRVEY